MKHYQKQFLELVLRENILKFGDFVLKSGRKSPYFFNAGLFNTGAVLRQVGMYYALALQDSNLDYDVLFGPAYKGIPLVCATAIALARYNKSAPFAFNRKEVKDHGEGGMIVGADLKGNVVLVDDVVTAGTAMRQSIELIEHAGAKVSGILVAFDRQEKGPKGCSVIEELKQDYSVPVFSILTFSHIVSFLEKDHAFLTVSDRLRLYREEYGVFDNSLKETKI